jgi:hypothetical protein
MSTYKVIQDIEAEDKLVGPLSLRQFIYALIASGGFYLCFLAIRKHVPYLMIVFFPIGGIAGFFAFPWKGDQPTEMWALAKIRYKIKPNRRIWDQSGIKHMVTVTAPKRVEKHYTNGLNQDEVQGRLKALADTIDSRGWAVKNVDINQMRHYDPNDPLGIQAESDRLVQSTSPQQVADKTDDADMLDEGTSVSQNLDAMLDQSSKHHREQLVAQIKARGQQAEDQQKAGISQEEANKTDSVYHADDPSQQARRGLPTLPSYDAPEISPLASPGPAPASDMQAPNDYWFLNGSGNQPENLVRPGSKSEDGTNGQNQSANSPDEAALTESLKKQSQDSQQISDSHLRVIQPLDAAHQVAGDNPANDSQTDGQSASNNDAATDDHTSAAAKTDDDKAESKPAPKKKSTASSNPAILELAKNDDLDVATIARQANREIRKSPDEVEIQLH